MNPKERRLAMRVEDHPIEYADFEGIIPEGNYGAGTVMVWDNGTFQQEGKPLDSGDFKFRLDGKKLKGSFVLVHTRANQWLLIKHRDQFVDPDWNLEKLDFSVLTGRSLQEIAEDKPAKKTARH